MPRYLYRAKDRKGSYNSGDIEAADEKEAILRLGAKGLHVIDLFLEKMSRKCPFCGAVNMIAALRCKNGDCLRTLPAASPHAEEPDESER